MADDPNDPTATPATGGTAEPTATPEMGDAGKKALEAERKRANEAEKALKAIQTRLKELEDKDKSDTDKLREQVDALTKERDTHAAKVLRAEIAMSKGLNAQQAKRLVGSTPEELEADADEILEAFPARTGATPPPSNRPKPNLQGGSEPSSEPVETDPAKLAAAVPRL